MNQELSNPYTIIILSSDPDPEFVGGIKRVTSILGKEWIKVGHTVYYLTSCNNAKRFDSKYSSFEGISQLFLKDYENYENPLNIKELKRVYEENNNQVIILNPHIEDKELTKFSFYLSEELNGKLVHALHFHPNFDNDLIRYNFFNNYIFKGLNPIKQSFIDSLLAIRYFSYIRRKNFKEQSDYLNSVISHSNAFVVLSKSFIPLIKDKINKEIHSKLYAINNPSPLTKNKFNLDEKKNVILWAGRMDNFYKRIDRMLKIWKKVSKKNPEWTLKVIGSGNIDHVRNIITKENIKNIQILGFQNPELFYKEASIISSTSVSEGWGMTLIEGMEYGCVPVAYDNNGSINDIINSGINGFIIPQGNISNYVKTLDFLMDNKGDRDKMALEAHKSIEKFNSTKIADKWIKLFNSL